MAQVSSPEAPAGSDAEFANEVLRIVVELAEELHPHQRGRRPPGLDGDLDDDFGLDSLGRVEVIHRLEAAFNTRLSEALFSEATTARDLVRAVAAAGPRWKPSPAAAVESRAAPEASAAPETLKTLNEVLAWHAAHQAGRAHAYISDGDREGAPLTYGQLFASARRLAGGLVAKGVEPGATIGLMLPTGEAFFTAFLGALLAGAIPAPIYPPWRMSQIEEHLRRQGRILAAAKVSGLIAFEEARPAARLIQAHVPTLAFVATADELDAPEAVAPRFTPKPDDLALLQFTSGSTADPKGVMLSHANILANVRALARAIQASPADVYVSWLPLYHDMGLIAAWLAALDQATPFVAMSPLAFMARPERWLWTIHRNRATISAAPNFAYELCLSIPEVRLKGLDLSSWRVAGCGAEPVSERTVDDFTRKFAPYGFRSDAWLPVYGLAESAAALTAPPLGRGLRVDHVDRRALSTRGEAEPVAADAPDAQTFVSCGAPLIGHEIRILGSDEREAPERREGRLQFRGPSATSGYYNAPQKTAELIREDGWLESGDLAYIADGEVFVTGRTKDIVKRAGRNIHPGDIETAVCGLTGVAPNGAVLFSVSDPARDIERLVMAVETALEDEVARQTLLRSVQELAADHLEMALDDIVLMPAGSIPRTESGKIRRPALRDAYLKGQASGEAMAPRRQLLRLEATALAGRGRRWLRNASEQLHAWRWWATLAAVGLVVWPLILILPGLQRRWRMVHAASRLCLRLLGHRMTVTGAAPTSGPVVYVANHSSYLDSLVLSAVLPGELAFAGYKELADNWLEGPFLRRLGMLFVERFEPTGAVADATKALKTLESGRPLVIFPEATIMRMPGLLEFHMGAFVSAAQAGAPVVPVAIRGTRNVLRHDHRWFPRRGEIEVHIGSPLQPSGRDFDAAVALKDAARQAILAQVHEPDLAEERALY